MPGERDPIPCPVCREVIIGPLSAAVHLSDMHGLSMYGALARLTRELEEAREREEDNKGEAWKPVKGATPAASEDVRERVRQAVGWGIEDAWPRYNRIHEPHDPDDESRQEWVDCITEQVATALLRTPHDPDRQTTQWYCPEGCGCVLDTRSARYHDCRTPSGEGEASRRLLWEAARVLGEIGGALEGSHDSVDWGVLRTDLRRVRRRLTTAALRSESPEAPSGEGERANCRCAPAAPWRSDGATCPDWPGCGNPDWRPATPQEAGDAER